MLIRIVLGHVPFRQASEARPGAMKFYRVNIYPPPESQQGQTRETDFHQTSFELISQYEIYVIRSRLQYCKELLEVG